MFKHYLTTALRNFLRHRILTSVNVLCLSLGISCFVIAYAVVTYLQSSEAAFPNSARTYFIAQTSNGVPTITPAPLAKYLRVDFPEVTVAHVTGGLFSLGDGHSLKVGDRVVATSPVFADQDFLKIFPLHFIAGDRAVALVNPRSVILTEQAAMKYFGKTDVVGRSIELNREAATVTGVITPPPQPSHLSNSPLAIMRFEVLVSMDVFDRWTEMQSGLGHNEDRWTGVYLTYAQLPRDGSLMLNEFNDRLKSFATLRVPPAGPVKRTFAAKPIASLTASLGDVFTGSIAALLMSLGGVVLLVACLNYANLATAQAASRAKEVGMRKVLGATRQQLMSQHLFETALLALAATVIALTAIAAAAIALNASMGIDLLTVVARNARFWAFLIALLAAVSVIAGAYPAFVLSRLRPAQTLRAGRNKMGGKSLASALVGVQFAVASLLVIAVVAIYRQNAAVHSSFKTPTDQVVVINTSLKSAGVSLESLRAELLRSSAVEAVSAVRVPPWSPAMSTVRISRVAEGFANKPSVRTHGVAFDFFQTFDMRLLAGRLFDSRQDIETSASGFLSNKVIVDRAFVAQLGFANPAAAVNQVIYYPGDATRPTATAQIIGVVDTQQLSLIGMGVSSNLYSLDVARSGFAVVRLARNSIPEGLAAIDSTWKRLAPDSPLTRVFVDELFERGYRYYDGIRQVFTGIAIFAFAIAAMGLIGMAVHIVGNRRHEIGVRKTLGATQQRVMSMLMWDFSKPVLIANLIAWPLAFGVEQGYARVIVDRAPISIVPYLLGLAITLTIAWAAVGAQAYRAARLHPANVLRHE